MSKSIKVLIVEKRDLLREKIAGILSREKNITMVIQVSSYSKLQTILGETVPDLVIADYFEFNKFCKEKCLVSGELFPEANILLYTDEYGQLNRIEMGSIGDKKIFNVRRIQQEVSSFLRDAKQRKSGNKK